MYFFSSLALTLNEPEEGVAPTDSRHRPDQRLMEEGHWDEANAEKQRLEEKQRTTRREREREAVKAANSPEEGIKKKTKNRKGMSLFLMCIYLSGGSVRWFPVHSSLSTLSGNVLSSCVCVIFKPSLRILSMTHP